MRVSRRSAGITDDRARLDVQTLNSVLILYGPSSVRKSASWKPGTRRSARRSPRQPGSRARSSCDFASLKDVDGLGQLPGAPRAAAELPHDPAGFELGIGAFAGRAEPGMRPVGVLLRGRLIPPPVRRPDVVLAEVALIADPSPTDRPDTVCGGWAPISLYQKRYRTLFVIEPVDAKTSACQRRRHDVTAERANRGRRRHGPACAPNGRKEETGSCQQDPRA